MAENQGCAAENREIMDHFAGRIPPAEFLESLVTPVRE